MIDKRKELEKSTDSILQRWAAQNVGSMSSDVPRSIADRVSVEAVSSPKTFRPTRPALVLVCAMSILCIATAAWWIVSAQRGKEIATNPIPANTGNEIDSTLDQQDLTNSLDTLLAEIEIVQEQIELIESSSEIAKMKSAILLQHDLIRRQHARDVVISYWSQQQSIQ